MKFNDLNIGDKVYIISNWDNVTIQPICDIVKHSHTTEFVLGPDPEEGHLLKASFRAFPDKMAMDAFIDNIFDDISEQLTICASEDAFKAAIESKLKDLRGSIEYYSKSLERVNKATRSCKDCKFYRENPRCMEEVLCDEFKSVN